jgi:hypothetical protein
VIRPPLEILGRAVGDDAAAVDHDGTGADGLDFLEDMGRNDNGLVLGHLGDQAAHMVLLVRIEAVGRLVHDQHRGVVEDRLGETDAALESLRQRLDALGRDTLEAGPGDRRVDTGGLAATVVAADFGDEIEERPGRHVAVGGRAFRQVAQLRLGLLGPVGDADPADAGRTAIRL